jgi:citrate synthase
MSLSAFILFHVTGREPSTAETAMLDALIIAISEHGLAPTAIAARMTYASGPEALQAAVAAGILGAGSVVLGSASDAAELIAKGVHQVRGGEDITNVARAIAEAEKAANRKLPGFGHPLHKPVDPRTVRLLALADELGIAGDNCAFLKVLAAVADQVWGKPLVLNIQGPIAAIGLDMGLPPFLTRAIPILARAIGVLGHIAEEAENPMGFTLAMLANDMARYRAPDGVESPVQVFG